MSNNKSLRDPLAIARGLGSAKNGVGHWWTQRLTAVALALLTPWFIWFAIAHLGAEQVIVRAYIAQPVHVSLLSAFVFALLWHAKLGLQVVVEDYVHVAWQEIALQIAIKLVYAFAALVAILAIGRIALVPLFS